MWASLIYTTFLCSTHSPSSMASMSMHEVPTQYGFPSGNKNLSPDNYNNYTLRAVLYINNTPRDTLSYNYNLTAARVSTIPTPSTRARVSTICLCCREQFFHSIYNSFEHCLN